MSRIEIDPERCKGCRLCVEACPKHLLRLRKTPNARGLYPAEATESAEAECTLCGSCFLVCPDCAILLRKREHAETTT